MLFVFSGETLTLLEIETGWGGIALGLQVAPGDDNLLLEDVTEVGGGAGGYATGEKAKDQVRYLGQTMMVTTPVGGFDGAAVPGFLARCSSFHAVFLFHYDP